MMPFHVYTVELARAYPIRHQVTETTVQHTSGCKGLIALFLNLKGVDRLNDVWQIFRIVAIISSASTTLMLGRLHPHCEWRERVCTVKNT
jgi:hypothetical protein